MQHLLQLVTQLMFGKLKPRNQTKRREKQHPVRLPISPLYHTHRQLLHETLNAPSQPKQFSHQHIANTRPNPPSPNPHPPSPPPKAQTFSTPSPSYKPPNPSARPAPSSTRTHPIPSPSLKSTTREPNGTDSGNWNPFSILSFPPPSGFFHLPLGIIIEIKPPLHIFSITLRNALFFSSSSTVNQIIIVRRLNLVSQKLPQHISRGEKKPRPNPPTQQKKKSSRRG